MADEQGTPAPTQPQIDPAFLQEQIQRGFANGYRQVAAEQAQAQARAEQARQQQAQAQQQSQDPLGAVINPYIQPAVQQMQTAAAAAMDAATFYATTPEAARHRDAIEAKFSEAYSAGRPIARADLFAWYKGVNQEAFIQERIKAMEAAAEAAKHAQTVGPGGGPHGTGQQPGKDPWAMTDEELDNFVKHATF